MTTYLGAYRVDPGNDQAIQEDDDMAAGGKTTHPDHLGLGVLVGPGHNANG